MLDHYITEFDGIKLYLTHDPANVPETWNGWVIHGHIHNNSRYFDIKQRYPYINYDMKRVNVSVELTNYKPMKLNTIVRQIKEGKPVSKELQPDKHTENQADNILLRIVKLVALKLKLS